MTSSEIIRPSTRWSFLILIVATLAVYALGNHGLIEPDEGRYANMALEWTEFGEHNWLDPVLSDVGHFDKPPLIYWVTGISLLTFGETDLAARLPALLGGILTLVGVGLIAFRKGGEKAAFWAVAACATTIQFWAMSRFLSPDILLCGFYTLGTALVLQKKGWLWFVGALFWALAWWTKATAALVPLGAITGALLICGEKDLLSRLRPLRLLLVILLLGSPWYIIMMNRHEELFSFFFVREVAGRITGHEDGRTGFFGFHFAVASVVWLPWWPFWIIRCRQLKDTWKNLSWNERRLKLPWEIVAATLVLVIFSCVSSKLITYSLPGVPLIAAWTGLMISEQSEAFRKKCVILFFAAGITLLIAGTLMPRFEDQVGRSSSIRKAVAIAKEQGADFLISDRFRPSLEFYFGENVWYITETDLTQAKDVAGQFIAAHFVLPDDLPGRVEQLDGDIWFLDLANRTYDWEPGLTASSIKKIEAGDLTLWHLKAPGPN
ncbi:MAG: glycosyltransferase family 39 protein [Verrucomicrobiales bacterium]|nr:glycosyltransferase family 39 protein [Verrucomicrobiales bacterium]